MKTTIVWPDWLVGTAEVIVALIDAIIGWVCWIGFVLGCLTTLVVGVSFSILVLYGCADEGSTGVWLPWLINLVSNHRWALGFLMLLGFTPKVGPTVGWHRLIIRFEKRPERF